MKSRLLLLTVFVLLLSACGIITPHGHGGFAEHMPQTSYDVEADQPLTPGHGLRFDFTLLRQHLDILVLEGAELCFPATVYQAKTREKRIAREIAGALEYDAANDIIIQRRLLSRLNRQLDYVKNHDVCTLPQTLPLLVPSDIGKKIQTLLNGDNQFAIDSFALNPKYIARLSEAAILLRDSQQYRLLITGHTDNQGDFAHNQQLSNNRARQVSRYLQIMGIRSDRIDLAAVGQTDPLLAGSHENVRLVNRRVTIELLETIPDELSNKMPNKLPRKLSSKVQKIAYKNAQKNTMGEK